MALKLKGRTEIILKKNGAPVKVDLDDPKELQMLLKDIGSKPKKDYKRVIL